LQSVTIKAQHPDGGFTGVNPSSGRPVKIRSAARLRHKVDTSLTIKEATEDTIVFTLVLARGKFRDYEALVKGETLRLTFEEGQHPYLSGPAS
jgi:hypothetical protein